MNNIFVSEPITQTWANLFWIKTGYNNPKKCRNRNKRKTKKHIYEKTWKNGMGKRANGTSEKINEQKIKKWTIVEC